MMHGTKKRTWKSSPVRCWVHRGGGVHCCATVKNSLEGSRMSPRENTDQCSRADYWLLRGVSTGCYHPLRFSFLFCFGGGKNGTRVSLKHTSSSSFGFAHVRTLLDDHGGGGVDDALHCLQATTVLAMQAIRTRMAI